MSKGFKAQRDDGQRGVSHTARNRESPLESRSTGHDAGIGSSRPQRSGSSTDSSR